MGFPILAFWLLVMLANAQTPYQIGQSVKTTSGTVTGQPSSLYNEVSEYLGVPFAQPPVGDLRFAPPAPIVNSTNEIKATRFPFSCIEIASRPSRSNPKAPQNIGAAENEMNEDCLYLNIWTKPQSGDKKKAVMIWIYGGGFVVGSASNKAYNGALLADQHDVVVVGVNYRLGVLGFPGASVPNKNPGLMDQRAAVEYLRDNIEAFGGDPKRMILFGQSAGGASVDYYAYGYTKDPIIYGFIPQSGNALMGSGGGSKALANWSGLSQRVGCGTVTAGKETANIDCLRKKPVQEILEASVPSNVQNAARMWAPQNDAKTGVFQNAAEQDFIQVPILVGNTNNENASGGSKSTSLSARVQNCPSHGAANLRRKANVKAWRYLFAGEFPNHTLGPCCPNAEGAWHGSELGLIFGTTESRGQGKDTESEKKLAKTLREAWSGFAKDPINGLERMGWPVYDPEKPTVVVLGGKDSAAVKFQSPQKLDPSCSALGFARNTGNGSSLIDMEST